MAISKDLYLAILSMDAYNQGYGVGINHGQTQVGNAVKISESETSAGSSAIAAGFYAVAYNDPTYGTIISYRGTDSFNFLSELTSVDLPISFGGSYEQSQIVLAQQFFDAVDAANGSSPMLLTGHSLGGGLASHAPHAPKP